MSEHSPYLQRLRNAGYNLTQARLTVLQVLEAEHGHITSADILEKVEEVNPSIGRASVFRTLEERLDVKISGHLLEFYGLCAACKKD